MLFSLTHSFCQTRMTFLSLSLSFSFSLSFSLYLSTTFQSLSTRNISAAWNLMFGKLFLFFFRKKMEQLKTEEEKEAKIKVNQRPFHSYRERGKKPQRKTFHSRLNLWLSWSTEHNGYLMSFQTQLPRVLFPVFKLLLCWGHSTLLSDPAAMASIPSIQVMTKLGGE